MKRVKNKKLTDFARGKDCTLRVPSVCSFDPSTSVFCHVSTKRMAGMGTKTHDFFGFIGCSRCHEWQEKNRRTNPDCADYTIDAICETQGLLIEAGLIQAK